MEPAHSDTLQQHSPKPEIDVEVVSPEVLPIVSEPAALPAKRVAPASESFEDMHSVSLGEELREHGWAGYRRLFEILWAGFRFAFPLWIDWFRMQKRNSLPSRSQRILHRIVKLLTKRSPEQKATLDAARAVRLRELMTRLGPTFIKVGQTLATRPDLLPLAYVKELALLQDEVPPFPNAQAWTRITEELGSTPNEVFLSIESEPLAAASLGQVYRARLKTGEEVVVKVQRPNLERIIELDLAALRWLARKLDKHPEWIDGVDWAGTVEEFGRMIAEEIDYEREIENAERFRKNFSGWPEIYVPRIYPELSSRRLITMEYIKGLKVTDLDRLKARDREPIEIIRLLTRTYLKQLLEDGFFHADPHPGNLRVMDDGKLAFFDFGMVGQITEEMRSGLIDAFFHIVERDMVGIVGDAISLGFLRPGYDPEAFRPAVENVFKQYNGLKIGMIRFQDLVNALSETLYEFPFYIPANYTFVIRALTTIEGIGLLTDPKFSFFDMARPHAKEFMLKRESAHIRNQILGKLIRGEEGNVSWTKVWNLVKLAYRTYFKTAPSNSAEGK